MQDQAFNKLNYHDSILYQLYKAQIGVSLFRWFH